MTFRSLLRAFSPLALGLLLAGCGQYSLPTKPVAATKGVSGTVHGGQNPISGATIQLWQVNSTTDGGLGTPLLTHTVTSSDGSGVNNSNANAGNAFNTLPNGDFTITGAYTCPVGDALVYITASGGNPGLAAGTNNPQSQMVTALGSCNALKTSVLFININEQTTVATVASLYAFMTAYNAIGASPAHAADISFAFSQMNEYVDFQAGTAPGPTLPANYSASTGDINLLANVLASCVNTTGGTYNDGSPCGTLFTYTSDTVNNIYTTDVTGAALSTRKKLLTPQIGNLPTPQAPFEPASTSVTDWSLPIFRLPEAPTFSLTPGTYPGTQLLHIYDADPTATIYWTNGAGNPNIFLQGELIINRTETIKANAVARGITTATTSASYTITTNSNAPTVSVASLTANAGSTAGVQIQANSTATGSVVTFSASAAVGGTFSPATCTISSGACVVTYTPSGTVAAGSYANALTANFSAAGSYIAATATSNVYIVAADTFQVLGAVGRAGLIQASDGYFYGADLEGTNDFGGVFRVDSSGNLTTLYSFTGGADGEFPEDRLIQGSDGFFYGAAYRGGESGNGTIFRLDASGNFTLLYTFTGSIDGSRPADNLVQGLDGSFYGTTAQGGQFGYGTVFKIDSSGNFTLLHAFNGTDGIGSSALLQGADGSFYSVSGGGEYNAGIVYKMDTSGNLTTLYSFTGLADGQNPGAALVQGTDSNFYGSTSAAGAYNGGTVFKITPSGTLTTLHSFYGQEGAYPFGSLVQAVDGDFYGSAYLGGAPGYGTLYKIDSVGNFTVLYQFTDSSDGTTPEYALVQGSDGSFYGTSNAAVYRLTPSPAVTAPIILTVPTSVTHGTGFTLTYTVANASSQTMQQCVATNTANSSGWTGIKTASTSSTNANLIAPSTTGAYTYTLTCGGTESGFATLNVN
jgi:uncharacterized repeat protein (TIGR03803 family)